MGSRPWLSIVLPTYQCEAYIVEAVESVRSQLCPGVQLIIVDDGSTDATWSLLQRQFAEDFLNGWLCYLYQPNGGLGSARNLGIAHSKGDYITFLDSDDMFLPGFFDEIRQLVGSAAFDVIEHGFVRFDDRTPPDHTSYRAMYPWVGEQRLEVIRDAYFARTLWYAPIRVFRRELWASVRFSSARAYEDLMTMHQHYSKDLRLFFVGRAFLAYRVNPSSITQNLKNSHLDDTLTFFDGLDTRVSSIWILALRTLRSAYTFSVRLRRSPSSVLKRLERLRHSRPHDVDAELMSADKLFLQFPFVYGVAIRAKWKLHGAISLISRA